MCPQEHRHILLFEAWLACMPWTRSKHHHVHLCWYHKVITCSTEQHSVMFSDGSWFYLHASGGCLGVQCRTVNNYDTNPTTGTIMWMKLITILSLTFAIFGGNIEQVNIWPERYSSHFAVSSTQHDLQYVLTNSLDSITARLFPTKHIWYMEEQQLTCLVSPPTTFSVLFQQVPNMIIMYHKIVFAICMYARVLTSVNDT